MRVLKVIKCPCGEDIYVEPYLEHRKKYCSKVCFYKYRGRKSGLKYKITKPNPSWFKVAENPKPTSKGYLLRKINGKTCRLHRVIVENHIGRKLNQYEVVHHINGIKTDNRIENLAVMTKWEHDNFHYGLGAWQRF